ncbi:restriction endonuclease subunit S [Citrobacter sp. Cf136]|uniref:restriction endonuclease subunit S n=1 Tax=Citrobacter sp. Cf136 TaxID=2985081 RepID=UPI002575B884|nr:restriction endonuclease subunit S [Citrobacter sp. Cf136]MDM3095127.1 restriction endonuclease subunit S [Citrobacter sp. Cf136]
MAVEKLIVDHIDTWTTALQTRSTAGRGSSGKIDLYGIKKLRELILELAVRGKLVPQDPNDEPASVLLERIAAEKAELVKQGKIKKPKPLPEISEEEKPFELPGGWEWARFETALDFSGGSQPPKSFFIEEPKEGYVQLIQIRDLGEYPQPVYVPINKVTKLCTSEDILIGRYGASVGKVFWGKNGAYNVALIKIDNSYNLYNNQFLFWLLKSPLGQSLFSGISRSAQDGFNKSDIAEKLLPVLSKKEQSKIVVRINDLMSLCDQLEQHSLSSLDAHQQLVETLLTTLTDSQNADELAESWARISEHFDTLFTTEASIDALKQTILQLAVMGKLVQSSDIVEHKKLKTFLSFGPRNGFSPVESKKNTQIKVLKLGATSYGELNIQESKFVDIDIDNNSHLYIKEGDILIQRGNSANFVGCNVLVKENHKNIIYPDLMMKIRTNEDLLPEYASIWLSSPLARGFMWDRMTGTSGTMPKISKKVVEEIPIIVPSIATQQKCIAFVNLAIKICSDLKIRLQTSQQTQFHLADALTDAAIN